MKTTDEIAREYARLAYLMDGIAESYGEECGDPDCSDCQSLRDYRQIADGMRRLADQYTAKVSLPVSQKESRK